MDRVRVERGRKDEMKVGARAVKHKLDLIHSSLLKRPYLRTGKKRRTGESVEIWTGRDADRGL